MRLTRHIVLFFCNFALLSILQTPAFAAKMSDVELLNATLVARLHFDPQPRKGQMVGAYQVSFRTASEEPITSVNVLLNPALEITKVVGAGGKNLAYRADHQTVASQAPLELMAATITLAKPILKGARRQEIVIHYKGFLQDLSVSGLTGVKETLHPDFTMIRAQSFGYPVFAEPNMDAIRAAWDHKPFYQVAFLDIPGHNKVVGNLGVGSKTTNGALTKFEMKSEVPAALMSLAIGDYTIDQHPYYRYAALRTHDTDTSSFTKEVDRIAARFEAALGPPSAKKSLSFIEIPDGFSALSGAGAYFLQPDMKDTHNGYAFMAINQLWRSNPTANPNHWATGLDLIIESELAINRAVEDESKIAFQHTKDLLAATPKIAKTPLIELAAEGLESVQDPFNVLSFAVLYDLLGHDAFFALARDLRSEFSVGYADLAAVGEYLEDNLKNKKARKFVQNWFFKGRISKDMKKAKSFEGLVALYR